MSISRCFIVVVCLCGTLCYAKQLQEFTNHAIDNGESPYIEKMTANIDGDSLVLRFGGNLLLDRKMDIVRRDNGRQYHHVDTRLIITLNNELLENFIITVGPDDAGDTIKAFPGNVAFKAADEFIEVRILLDTLKYGPLEVLAEMNSNWYLDENMLVRCDRNLFSDKDGGPARITSEKLPHKPGLPKILDFQVQKIGSDFANLKWETNNYTNAELQIKLPGQKTQVVHHDFRSKQHMATVTGLQPNTNYAVEIIGEDFAGRQFKADGIEFRTQLAKEIAVKNDEWLSVKGKYIVNSRGDPFPLGGYSHYVGEYWHNEFPRYGTLALTARHFRSMGFNACRLGLVEDNPWWAASIMRQGSAFDLYGGAEGYVKRFLRPLVDQVVAEGVYVIIDWHWSYKMDEEDVRRIGDFWEACAREFKDEPGVAMYQLLNEPSFSDIGGTKPELAPRLRDITKDYIQRIRKHDTRHIILVPDWNSGWGSATESQWKPVNFDTGDKYKQIVYSKHIEGSHLHERFLRDFIDKVVDKWDIPIFFDEVENSTIMTSRQTGWFYNFLKNNPRKYGFLIWVCGQYPQDFVRTGAAFCQYYLPVPPLKSHDSNPIVGWWRLKEPNVVKRSDKWFYHYKLPNTFESGDYGVIVEGATLGTYYSVAVVSEKNGLIGTHLGVPECARWTKNDKDILFSPHRITNGQSAAQALYWHALEPFTEVVVRTDREIGDWNEIQIIRLNPKHQMPLPRVKDLKVEYESDKKIHEKMHGF